MKRIIIALTVIICTNAAFAQRKFTIGSITYKKTSRSEVKVKAYNEIDSVVNIPATVEYNKRTYTVTAIDKEAFYNCDKIISITIPNTIERIGKQAFYDCDNIKNIEIPSSVKHIGKEVFCGCHRLTSVVLNNSFKM